MKKKKKMTALELTVLSFWPRCYTTKDTKAMNSESGAHLYFILSHDSDFTNACTQKPVFFKPLTTHSIL